MTKKEIATMVAETINGLEAGMAMVGEKDGQPSVIIGKESVRPSFNVTDDIANHVNACKNEDVYVALAEVAADMRAVSYTHLFMSAIMEKKIISRQIFLDTQNVLRK